MTVESRSRRGGNRSYDTWRQPPPPVAYLLIVNGNKMRLVSPSEARAMFDTVVANPGLDVNGNLAEGFSWRAPCAVPNRRLAYRPLTAAELVDEAVPISTTHPLPDDCDAHSTPR